MVTILKNYRKHIYETGSFVRNKKAEGSWFEPQYLKLTPGDFYWPLLSIGKLQWGIK